MKEQLKQKGIYEQGNKSVDIFKFEGEYQACVMVKGNTESWSYATPWVKSRDQAINDGIAKFNSV